jgi:hypothetical protein
MQARRRPQFAVVSALAGECLIQALRTFRIGVVTPIKAEERVPVASVLGTEVEIQMWIPCLEAEVIADPGSHLCLLCIRAETP